MKLPKVQIDENIEVVLDIEQARSYRQAYNAVYQAARDGCVGERHAGCMQSMKLMAAVSLVVENAVLVA